MQAIINHNIETIESLCKQHKVKNLYAFGSVLMKDFKANSDIDLLVDFEGVDLNNYADNFFDFKFSLEDILKRKIDLLENKAINNPYLRGNIEQNKQLIYG
jgi:predicted nucleotidyltransferase